MVGDRDRLVTVERAEEAAHALGEGARVVVLPRTGHCSQSERPRTVARHLDELIGQAG